MERLITITEARNIRRTLEIVIKREGYSPEVAQMKRRMTLKTLANMLNIKPVELLEQLMAND